MKEAEFLLNVFLYVYCYVTLFLLLIFIMLCLYTVTGYLLLHGSFCGGVLICVLLLRSPRDSGNRMDNKIIVGLLFSVYNN